jgi:hypothetical protein
MLYETLASGISSQVSSAFLAGYAVDGPPKAGAAIFLTQQK